MSGARRPIPTAIDACAGQGVAADDTNDLDEWDRIGETPGDPERDIAQAKALRDRAREGGLRFEVFLPPGLAEWILDFVARGVFTSPSDAAFVMLGEQRDLEPHADLRREILKRTFRPRSTIRGRHSAEELRETCASAGGRPRPEPAVWIARPTETKYRAKHYVLLSRPRAPGAAASSRLPILSPELLRRNGRPRVARSRPERCASVSPGAGRGAARGRAERRA